MPILLYSASFSAKLYPYRSGPREQRRGLRMTAAQPVRAHGTRTISFVFNFQRAIRISTPLDVALSENALSTPYFSRYSAGIVILLLGCMKLLDWDSEVRPRNKLPC